MEFFPDFADHAPFVWAAYGVSFLALAGLTLVLILRARASRRRLETVQRAVSDMFGKGKDAA